MIVLGGPMMGQAQLSLEVPALRGTSGVLVLRPTDLALAPEGPCIPLRPLRAGLPDPPGPDHDPPPVRAWKRFAEAEQRRALDCIECGSCSYTCPAGLPLVQAIRHAKRRSSPGAGGNVETLPYLEASPHVHARQGDRADHARGHLQPAAGLRGGGVLLSVWRRCRCCCWRPWAAWPWRPPASA